MIHRFALIALVFLLYAGTASTETTNTAERLCPAFGITSKDAASQARSCTIKKGMTIKMVFMSDGWLRPGFGEIPVLLKIEGTPLYFVGVAGLFDGDVLVHIRGTDSKKAKTIAMAQISLNKDGAPVCSLSVSSSLVPYKCTEISIKAGQAFEARVIEDFDAQSFVDSQAKPSKAHDE